MRKRIIMAIYLLSLWQAASPACAQPYMRETIERRLGEANNYFQQNDYEMGANRIREVCSLLKSAPQAMPEVGYIQIASSKVDFIDGKLRSALDSHNYDAAKPLLTAETTLLTSLSNWEPQNPKWHYQKAVLYHASAGIPMTGVGAAMAAHLGIQNNLHNELDMRPLQSAIQECDKVLGLADPSYRDKAANLKNQCQSEMQRRTGKINAANAEYQRKLPKGMPPPGLSNPGYTPPETHYCSKCGMSHSSWVCPYTHGG